MGNVRQDTSIQIHVWDTENPPNYDVWLALQKCDRPTDPASVAVRTYERLRSPDAVIRMVLSLDERAAAKADADAMAIVTPNADQYELFLQGAIEVVQSRTFNNIPIPNQYHEAALVNLLQLHTTETTTADVDKMYPEPIPGLDRKDCKAVVEYFCKKHLQEFGGVGCKAKEDWLRANTTYSFSENTIRNKAGTVHKTAQNYARNERERMATPDDCEPSLSIQENKRRSGITREEKATESPKSQKLIERANKLLKDNK